jgi:hypothetical protein
MALSDIIALLSSSLIANNPNLDLRPGTPFNDLFITSTAAALNIIDQEIEHDRIVSYLGNWQSMTIDELALLASNFFVNYPSGTYATGVVRVYYSQPVDFVATALSDFYSSAGNAYIPIQPVTVSAEQMTYQTDGLLYYVDVPVIATSTGSAYNITSSGQIVSADNIPDYVRVTNLMPFTEGVDQPTPAQFYAMIQNSLTTRDFVSAVSIYATLTQAYGNIRNVVVCGYGDPEMQRDIVQYSATGTMHAGSMVDVYIDMNGTQRVGVESSPVYVNGGSSTGLPPTSTPFVSDWGVNGIIPSSTLFYLLPTATCSYSSTLPPQPMYFAQLIFGTIQNLYTTYLLDHSTDGNLIISDQIRLPLNATITAPNTPAGYTSDGAMDYGLGDYGGGWYGVGNGYDFFFAITPGTEWSDRSVIRVLFNPDKYQVGGFQVSFSYEEKSTLSTIDSHILSGYRNTVADVQPRQTYPLVVDLGIVINNYDPVLLVGFSGEGQPSVWDDYVASIETAIANYIRTTPVTQGLYVGDIIDIIYQYNSNLRVVTPFYGFRITLYHPQNFKEVFLVTSSFTQISSSFNPSITNRICSFYPGTIKLIQGVAG